MIHAKMWLCLTILLLLFLTACAPAGETAAPTATSATVTPTPTVTATPTGVPTATPTAVSAADPAPSETPSPTPAPSLCSGLSGEIETQILVGPSEAVGLEPVAVGSVPFSTASSPPYDVQGGGSITYEDTLTREWGSFSVTMEMNGTIQGTCREEGGGAVLDLAITMAGNQNTKVSAGGFQREYPWSGSNTFDLTFPAVEGASVAGEGWSFVLHLDGG